MNGRPSRLALIILWSVAACANRAASAESVRWEPYEVRSFDGRSIAAQLGHIRVPERRDRRDGRMIEVAFVKLPSTAAAPGDPIVFLMGGPGVAASAMAPIPPYFTLFERLRARADVILLDPRGLGRSSPVLECPADSALPADVFATRMRLVEVIAGRTKACADWWRAHGADPCAYSTVESADDVEDIRRGLGARRLDLLGFSYGTRLAMAVLQRHRTGVGRVVLAGVNRPGRPAKGVDAIDRKLASWSERLARDSTWKARSDLLDAGRAVRERLQASPAVVSIADRQNQRPVSLAVGWEGFTALLALHLDDPRLPALLVTVAAGDDSVLARMAEADYNALGSAPTGLMARAVSCASGHGAQSESAPGVDAGTVFGEPIDNEFLREPFCKSMGCDDTPVDFQTSVRSDAPALFITGSLDCTTPSSSVAAIRPGFSNAATLEVENAGHETLPIPVVQDAVVSFFRDGKIAGSHGTAEPPGVTSIAEAKRATGSRRR
jgi:pimeloyl-ACP methyl ester carboxylesterase